MNPDDNDHTENQNNALSVEPQNNALPVEPDGLKENVEEVVEEEVETEDGYETEEEEGEDEEVQNILAVADLSAPIAVEENLEEKHCWICFGSEQDDPSASWIHPCK